MKLLKQISNKILIILMIIINLSFFSASSVVQAKLTLEDGEFYYSGTQEGQYVVKQGATWDGILKSLGDIANYLLGIIITLAIRGPIVGWLELSEIALTAILQMPLNFTDFISNAISGMDSYSQDVVNIEKIIFNEVPLLNANIFSSESAISVDETGEEVELNSHDGNEVATIIKDNVAKWYYVLRLGVIAFMLVLLIFIGIKMTISTIASEKAMYQRMLVDWLVGFIIVFSIHYIMIVIFSINDSIVDALKPLTKNSTSTILEEYQYGEERNIKTAAEIENTLYETARTRAYSLKLTDGFTGMIIYGVLIYFAWRFALIYFRRMLNVIVLTLFAPVIAASYAFNKVLTGKSKVFSTWLKEYILNVIIQIVHAIIYVSFLSMALELSLVSIGCTIIAFVILHFMDQADKLLRQLFKVTGGKGSLVGDMADRTTFKGMRKEIKDMQNAMVGGTLTKMGMKATYGAVTKPLAAGVTRAVAKKVVKAKNSVDYEYRKKKKEEREAKDRIDDSKEFIQKEFIENTEQYKQIQELEAEKERLRTKKLSNQEAKQEYKRIQQEIEAKQLEIEQEIESRHAEIEKAYISAKLDEKVSIREVFKRNLEDALDDLVEMETDEDGKITGKYKIKDVKTRREGGFESEWGYKKDENGKWILGYRGAFWRKEEDSLTLRFKNNMKLTSLLGIDSKQNKILKSEMDFWKKRILGLFSTVAGVPGLVVNPLVGMTMLGNSAITELDVAKRKRIYKNKAVSPIGGKYKFRAFDGRAVKKLSMPASYHMLEIQKLDAVQQKRNRKELKRITQKLNSNIRHEKQIKNITKKEKQAWSQKEFDYEKNLKNVNTQKSLNQLAFEEKLNQKNVVSVGKNVAMEMKASNTKYDSFIRGIRSFSNIKKENTRNKIKDDSHVQELQKKNIEIENNEEVLIANQIVKFCKENKIKIEEFNLEGTTSTQISINIQTELKVRGALKPNEVIKTDYESIENVVKKLKANNKETNKLIAEENTILNDSANEVLEDIKQINSVTKTDFIIEEMNKNKDAILKEVVMELCVQEGKTNIKDFELTDNDMFQINKNIFDILRQEAGVPIDEEIVLKKDSISEFVAKLSNAQNVEKTNDELLDRIIERTMLKYMGDNEIKNENELKVQSTQEKICNLVIDKTTPKSSKQSAKVIAKLKGRNSEESVEEEIIQSEKINKLLEKISEKAGNVQKVTIDNIQTEDSKGELIERAVNRQMAQTADKLEQIFYLEIMDEVNYSGYNDLSKKERKVKETNEDTGETIERSVTIDELGNKRKDELRKDLSKEENDLLDLLHNMAKQNKRLDEIGLGNESENHNTREKMKYFAEHDGSRKFDETKDGSRRVNFDDTKDLKLKRQIEEADVLLHGEAVDISELIKMMRK